MIKLTELIEQKLPTYWYTGVNPTVDMVIIKNGKLLLILRGGEVEHGKWALPGGFIDTPAKKGEPWIQGHETPLQAAIREVKEETGLDVDKISKLIKPIGIYEGNNRDPRDTKESWSRSNAFGLILPNDIDSNVTAMDDAKDANWFDIKHLPIIAFDHLKIIKDGLKKLLKSGDSNEKI